MDISAELNRSTISRMHTSAPRSDESIDKQPVFIGESGHGTRSQFDQSACAAHGVAR
jgi:hypothetical protein